MSRMNVNIDNVRRKYAEILQENNWMEFLTALAIAERAYTIDDISELTDDEIDKVAEIMESYDTIFHDGINIDIDRLINDPREDY